MIGSGHIQGAPDTLTAELGIEFTAADVTAATNQTNQRQRAVIDAVEKAGVERKDLNTTGLAVQPQYDDASGTLIGYRAENTIEIKVRKLDSACPCWPMSSAPAATPLGSALCAPMTTDIPL